MEVTLARALGQDNLQRALEDKLNEGWNLLQVVFCGMGSAGGPSLVGGKPAIYPVFLAIFTKLD